MGLDWGIKNSLRFRPFASPGCVSYCRSIWHAFLAFFPVRPFLGHLVARGTQESSFFMSDGRIWGSPRSFGCQWASRDPWKMRAVLLDTTAGGLYLRVCRCEVSQESHVVGISTKYNRRRFRYCNRYRWVIKAYCKSVHRLWFIL